MKFKSNINNNFNSNRYWQFRQTMEDYIQKRCNNHNHCIMRNHPWHGCWFCNRRRCGGTSSNRSL